VGVKMNLKSIFSRNKEKSQEELAEEKIYTASQWQLMWRKFKKHKLAMGSAVVIISLYLIAIFAPFLSPYDPQEFSSSHNYVPPTSVNFVDQEGDFSFRPFVYGIKREIDPDSWQRVYTEDKSQKYPINFFVRGFEYDFLGIFETDLHLFGTEGDGRVFLLGTDKLGRDLFSKILYGARISMSIGLIGIVISFALGLFFGGISGYYGGVIDTIIQRVIELIKSFPRIPLWMALSASFPPEWSPITVYFMIIVILSLIGWTGLARVVRGKFLSLREEDYTTAARLSGASEFYIITRHFIPSFMSYIIASISLKVPAMILGETSLSFLGIGLRPPIISWGVLLQEAQNVNSIAMHPWLFTPAIMIVITVLAFNFLGDGLRDAADPYGNN
jgi:peptide/nickel transport system permease protein